MFRAHGYRALPSLLAAWAVSAEMGAQAAPRVTLRVYEPSFDAGPATSAAAPPRPSDWAQALEDRAGERLAADGRLDFRPLGERLAPPPAEAARALTEADSRLNQAGLSFGEMDLDKTRAEVQGALDTYVKYLPELARRPGGIRPLVDAWLQLAKARFFDGNNDGARDALRYAFALEPTLEFDPRAFPPQMKKTVVEARLLFETLGGGRLAIDSDPPGATVWRNGVRLAKPTPLEVDAPPGPSYLTLERRDYARSSALVEVAGGGETSSTVQPLERYPHNPIAPLDRARAQLDQGSSPELREAAQALGVDWLVLVRPSVTAEGTRLAAYLYDARPDRILKKAARTVAPAEVEAAARELLTEVTSGVPLDGVLPPAAPEKAPSWWARFSAKTHDGFARFGQRTREDLGRFRRWKGFWYVVGGVAGAAVIATAVGAGVGARQHPTPGEAVIVLGGR